MEQSRLKDRNKNFIAVTELSHTTKVHCFDHVKIPLEHAPTIKIMRRYAIPQRIETYIIMTRICNIKFKICGKQITNPWLVYIKCWLIAIFDQNIFDIKVNERTVITN